MTSNAVCYKTGKTVYTGSEDQSVRIWNPRTGECAVSVRGDLFHRGEIICMDVCPNSSLCATGSSDMTTKVVQIATGKVGNRRLLFKGFPSSPCKYLIACGKLRQSYSENASSRPDPLFLGGAYRGSDNSRVFKRNEFTCYRIYR